MTVGWSTNRFTCFALCQELVLLGRQVQQTALRFAYIYIPYRRGAGQNTDVPTARNWFCLEDRAISKGFIYFKPAADEYTSLSASATQ